MSDVMTEKVKDETEPTGRWAFDEDVTAAFEDMLERSVPQHDVMRRAVFDLGSRFVMEKTAVVDLGCSRGEAMAPLVDRFGARCRFVGVECSEPMLAAARERFRGLIDCGVVEVRAMDLRRDFPPVKASLVLSVLTLQFVPIEHRQGLVRRAFRSLVPGGAMILVEKVLGGDAEIDEVLREEYWALKRENGYTQDSIDRKRLSLEGVLVPVTAAWNEELLRAAGFRSVDCFWAWMNFRGWLAIKEKE